MTGADWGRKLGLPSAMPREIVRATSPAAKRRPAALLAAMGVFLAGCAAVPERPRMSAAPAAPPAVPERFDEIIVPDFAEAAPVPDLSFGRRIADDLAAGMRDVFKGRVSRRPGPSGTGAAALDRDFWRSAGAGARSAVFLFGTAALTEQAQKALKEDDLPKDGPFKLEGHGLAERKRFVLIIGFALIDAATGETLWTSEVKETRISNEIVETPEFALAELLPPVRARLFLMLFGRSHADRRGSPAR